MQERVAVIDGVRTPFCRAGGVLRDVQADDLGAYVVKELLARTAFPGKDVESLIFGNVINPPHLANIARIIAVKAGLPLEVAAHTVNRNCASGLEAISEAATLILLGHADAVIAGGTESMSNFPITFPKAMGPFLQKLSKAKTTMQKLAVLAGFKPSLIYPQLPGLTDPLCGLSMGQTAEVLAREFSLDRASQDDYALRSQQRAAAASKKGYFAEEITPVPLPPGYSTFQNADDGIRENQDLQSLAALRPAFERTNGTVTAGNASQMTDGAVALLLMPESKAKELGYKPLGYIRDFAYVGTSPRRMGIGPVFATAKVLDRAKLTLNDIDLIELNEAFAVQVLSCQSAFNSDAFAKAELHRDKALGELDSEKLNVNGGAIALGHPLGASGSRLVLTLLRELRRRGKHLGLATMCVGGGQGGAMIVEVDNG